jgi:hypothetical protein
MWNRLAQAAAITMTLSFLAHEAPMAAPSIAAVPQPFSLDIHELKLPFKPAWFDPSQPLAMSVRRR